MNDTKLTAAELLDVPAMRIPNLVIDGARVHLIERDPKPSQQPVSDRKTRQSDE